MKNSIKALCQLFSVLILSAGIGASDARCSTPEKIITDTIKRHMQERAIPGVAVGLYYKSDAYFYNFGIADPFTGLPVTRHTIFEIGSITKSFIATVLAMEVQKKTMHLADPLEKYLPLAKNSSFALRKLTLKQLATHTSSLPRKPPVRRAAMSEERVLRHLLYWKPQWPIGSTYHYSNLGFNLIGYVLEHKTGKSYESLMHDYIIAPLHMNSTMVKVPSRLKGLYAQGYNKRGIPVPRMHDHFLGAAGALKSTTSDMMQFLKANLGLVGPKSLINAMKQTQKEIFIVDHRFSQGLSWERKTEDGITVIDKNGGVTGFSTWIGIVPKKGMGLILLTNKRNSELAAVGRTILHQLSHLK